MPRLAGKHALVTGAGGGIGRSIARLFAREGAAVAALDQDRAAVEHTRLEIEQEGGRALALVADVGDGGAVAQAFRQVRAEFPTLDALVNCAGVAVRRSFEKLSDEDWEKVWATNLQGAILCTRAALPLLRREPGAAVINVASIQAFRHSRKLAAYAVSKGALVSLSRSLALELAPHGIRVNYICPGFIRTDMTRPFLDRWLFRKYVERRTPLGRLGEPEDVARVAVFLASPDSGFITGEGIVVDGGLTLRAF